MKPKSVKTKVNQLVKDFGSVRAAAWGIGIEKSYIYKLLKGTVPGVHLYRHICDLCENLKKR